MSLPKPYYEDEEHGIVIYNADCRDILPHLPKVDLLLTDPPYGIGEHGGKCRTRGKPIPNHVSMGWDNATPATQVFEMMFSRSDHQLIWGGNYFTDKGLPPKMGWLYWDKCMGGDFSDGELAFTSRDSALKAITLPRSSFGNEHPTQKPLALMLWCLGFFPKAQTVLDPFMGSGTTLVACKQLGRHCIGIEIEESYCEIAAKRLSQGMLFGQEELAQIGGGK